MDRLPDRTSAVRIPTRRDSYASNVEQFLNRIMVLHVEKLQPHLRPVLRALPAGGGGGQATRGVGPASRLCRFGMEEIRARNLRRVSEAETLFVDPASGARTMLHELEGEVLAKPACWMSFDTPSL